MKKLLYLLLGGLLLMGPMSCKKDEPEAPALASAPEATAADDAKSGGVYKGIIIGSSGTFKIVLQGGKKEIIVKIDGVTKTLTTTDLDDWESGDEIVDAEFSSGDWTIIFSVGTDGSGATMGFSIPGHSGLNATFIKEMSDGLVMAFEGTYAGSDTGTWNFLVQGDFLVGISRSTDNDNGSFYGTVDGTTVDITIAGSTGTATGTINGNTISGTWTGSTDFHGTFTGTRTL